MKGYQVYIFDWDGTLMDSVARIVSSIQACAKLAKLPVPDFDTAKSIIGLSLPEAFAQLFPDHISQGQAHIDGKPLSELLTIEYKQQFRELNQTPCLMFDHAETLLQTLKAQDKVLAVATGKSRRGLELMWQTSGTEQYFTTARCSDEAESKPSPDMLNQLLAELEVEPEQVVMIGDSCFDMEMAQRAGVDRVAVTYGVENAERLSQYQPKYTFDSVAEMLASIQD